MNNSKTAIVISSIIQNIQLILGIAFTALFGLCIIVGIAEYKKGDMPFIIFCIVLTALGIFWIVLSRKRASLIRDFRRYVTILSNDPTGSIANLAMKTGTSEDVVRNNLELMIKKRYFANAAIDRSTDCILFPNHGTAQQFANQANTNNNAFSPRAAGEAATMVTITCKGCGAVNTIAKGKIVECEYCGSALQG